MEHSSYDILVSKLQEFRQKYYKSRLIKGLILSAALVLTFFLFINTLEYFGRFEQSWRALFFYSLITVTLVTIAFWVIVPITKLLNVGRVLSDKEAADIIGTHFSDVQDKLLNVIQLKQEEVNSPSNRDLIEASIKQKTKELSPIPFSTAVNFSENKRWMKFLLPPAFIFLGFILIYPSFIREPGARIINHAQVYEKPQPFYFNFEKEELIAAQNSDYELIVSITGKELPSEVWIEFEGNKQKLKKDQKNVFSYVFRNVQKNTLFSIFSGDVSSSDKELKVTPSPVISGFSVSLDYPSYTGKKDEKLNNIGDFSIPQGTKITWFFDAQNTDEIRLFLPDSTVDLKPKGSRNSFQHEKTAMSSFRYFTLPANEYSESKDSLQFLVNVIPDANPLIALEEKADSLSNKRIYFKGDIKDDYGFSSLLFHYQFSKGPDSLMGQAFQDKLLVNSNRQSDYFFYTWDLSGLNIKAGDELSYYFEIWDNDAVNGSKYARTEKKVFKAPSMEELEQKKEVNDEKIKDELEAAIKETQEIQEGLQKLGNKLIDKKELLWEDKEQLKQLLEQQQQLEEKLNEIKSENQKNNNEQSEYKEVNERILDKQKQIEDLFEQVMSEEMKELFRKMEEMMDKLNKEQMKDMMEQMELSNENIEKELDRTLEVFKQLEFEQKLQETIDKMDELKEKQEELAEKTENKSESKEKLEEQQKELNKEFEQLKEDMKALQEKNEQLENKQELPNLEEEMKSTEEEMKKGEEEIKEGKNKKAAESQKKAAEKMEEMSEKLGAAQEQMQDQAKQEDIDALRQLLENLVKLSFDQEAVLAELKTTDRNDPQYVKLSQTQKKLKDDAQLIEDSLLALSKRNPQIEADVNREINLVNMNMEQSLHFLTERNTGMVLTKQQTVMTSVNNLALMLDQILQQMQQQMSEQKFGNSSCSKPGNNSKPSSATMKQMQQKLNEQMEKMKKQMEKEGQTPNKTGKKGQGQGMSKDLAKMAAEQEAIRNEIKKLSEELGKEGDGSGKGNLDKLTKLMEETERDLVNKNITEETLKRQQEIMTRLLESERAEREREKDNKRESKEGNIESAGNPFEKDAYKAKKQRETELLKTVSPDMKPYYKQKVNEYFNTIQ